MPIWITALFPIFTTLINKIFPDPVEQANANAALQAALNQASALQLEAQAKMQASVAEIANTEASSPNKYVSYCRPTLMYLFMIIIALNYIISPLLGATGLIVPVLSIPPNMWDLLMVCGGLYMGGSSLETASAHFSNKKFYDQYKKQFGKLDQNTVNKLDAVIKTSQE